MVLKAKSTMCRLTEAGGLQDFVNLFGIITFGGPVEDEMRRGTEMFGATLPDPWSLSAPQTNHIA